MTTKRQNPYTTLKNEFRDWVRKCIHRRRKVMWSYPKDRLNEGWKLHQLWSRVAAAKQLGYDVQLEATDAGLSVVYVKEVPEKPWHLE